MLMNKNPFKFGTVVKDAFFTNRVKETARINEILQSENHLILIAPRRYGKTSLVSKVIDELDRPVISLDLQLITSVYDLANQLLKRIYREYPAERVKQYVKHFRIAPSISVNPHTDSVDVSFNTQDDWQPIIEDVLNILEELSRKKSRLVVVFDEFQEIGNIDKNLYSQLRSIMQYHQHINYLFLGSQESLIRDIFEKKNSPFYHFGLLMTLNKISAGDFSIYLEERFQSITKHYGRIAQAILEITTCHPYYTQQLAWAVWEKVRQGDDDEFVVEAAVTELIYSHDNDYERIWAGFNRTDRKMLIALSAGGGSVITDSFLRQNHLGATSTAYSCLKRLSQNGYIVKTEKAYELDDPFFSLWISRRREA